MPAEFQLLFTTLIFSEIKVFMYIVIDLPYSNTKTLSECSKLIAANSQLHLIN